ncbi:DeoR family transcriptional regulator [Enterococcus raffinosus]|uniref:DeoR family transcriptional regulator n=1 Tax=Enterococcus raffinosus TaxID=71452 RepID=UPI00288FFDE6|nr:DeoR family transcriptional regulator [Enterococcus raffinosus]MDT2531967.1 DeoR family transcriptional regulator [Enterococcus raffinosus]
MEEEQNYVPKIIYSEIDGDKTKEIYKTVIKNKNISKGLNTSLKSVGRPIIISENSVKRAYNLWKKKKITQKKIAENWKVSERTVRRRFKEIAKE